MNNKRESIHRKLIASGINLPSESMEELIESCEQLELAMTGSAESMIDLYNAYVNTGLWHDTLYVLGALYKKPLNKRKLRSSVGLKRTLKGKL